MENFRETVKKMLEVPEETLLENGFMDRDDYASFVCDQVRSFAAYYNSVIDYVLDVEAAALKDDPAETREMIMVADNRRRIKHNACISACDILNRTMGKLGLEPPCDIDTGDRYAVNAFVGEAISDLYFSETERYQHREKWKEAELDADDKVDDKNVPEFEGIGNMEKSDPPDFSKAGQAQGMAERLWAMRQQPLADVIQDAKAEAQAEWGKNGNMVDKRHER